MIWDVFYGNYVGVVDFVKYIQGKTKIKILIFFSCVLQRKKLLSNINFSSCNGVEKRYLLKYSLVLFKYD